MIVKFVQGQRKGKTALIVGSILWLMGYGGYRPSECCGNFNIFVDGYRKFTNAQMLALLKVMVQKHVRHRVVGLTEADRLFPPRNWHNKEQTNALIGLWQDEKLDNWFLYDTHWGDVDILLREATQIIVVPEYHPELDSIWVEIISKIDRIPSISAEVTGVSRRIFPWYDTKEPCV